MLISFFLAHSLSGVTRMQKLILRIAMLVSCAVLYIGAMWVMPSDGTSMTKENIWHGILSFGGMLMIFLTYCLYTVFIRKKDRDGAGLLAAFLAFSAKSTFAKGRWSRTKDRFLNISVRSTTAQVMMARSDVSSTSSNYISIFPLPVSKQDARSCLDIPSSR